MKEQKTILVVGHPGSGKGIFAKQLAEKLNVKFIDADFGLEYHIGRTIDEILGESGACQFQVCQKQLLSSFVKEREVVVATDASAIDKGDLQFLADAIVIYLKVNLPIQLERISR